MQSPLALVVVLTKGFPQVTPLKIEYAGIYMLYIDLTTLYPRLILTKYNPVAVAINTPNTWPITDAR